LGNWGKRQKHKTDFTDTEDVFAFTAQAV